ncbi:MAG TPA: cyclic nucleotide-binding domain-containing protein [Nitrospira sp.]|nr:cyclic nucleotide-binding domain-containing protein [Nitrospira sp.]
MSVQYRTDVGCKEQKLSRKPFRCFEQCACHCPNTFLSEVGRGKTSLPSPNKHTIFSRRDAADAVFYIQAGKVKLTVVSQQGKEAVVAILEQGAFFGEACLAGQTVRTATATTAEDSRLVHIDKEAVIQALHE